MTFTGELNTLKMLPLLKESIMFLFRINYKMFLFTVSFFFFSGIPVVLVNLKN